MAGLYASSAKYKSAKPSQNITTTGRTTRKPVAEGSTLLGKATPKLPLDNFAAQKVFNITELCEQILDHLSPEDLYYAQFICGKSHYIIRESPKF